MMHYYKKTGFIRWSDAEIELLKELYPKFRVKNIARKFPLRTKSTIVAKALDLNLPSAKLWQPKENAILKKHFANSSKENLQKMLPKRSWTAIIAQGERRGLKRTTNKPRRNVNENYFKIWSPAMAYILGFIVADGCIIRGSYKGYSDSLRFGVHIKDRDILEKIKRELNSNHSISTVKNASHLCITSQKMVNDLKCLQVSYRKSLREKVPDIPQEFIRDFIRGIVDGDGSIWIDKRLYPTLGITGGKEILTFINENFYKTFKKHSALTKQSYSEDAKKYLYQISYRASSAQVLIEYLYKDAGLFLDRKNKIAITCLESRIKKRENSKYIKQRYEAYISRESDESNNAKKIFGK